MEVVTDKGTELILLRFADALNELGNVDGFQIHRSHWVARSAIKDIQRQEGKVIITTKKVAKNYR